MLRTFLKSLILVPIAVVLILFAVANRQWTAVSLDPFSGDSPVLAVHLPLFLAILLTLIFGVAVGGVAAWIGQRKWRRAARRLEAELRGCRDQVDAWQRRIETEHTASTAVAPLTYRPPPAA
jgi:uncharacterized integral membrane protein